MDVARVRQLLDVEGPFASVHFEDTHDTADAAKQLDLKLREIATSLAEQGADTATIEAIEAAVRDSPPATGRSGRSIIAARGTVLLDERLAEPPGRPSVRFSPLPYLVPFAAHTESLPPYLIVRVDQLGVDITAYGPQRQPLGSETVTGREHPVHEVHGDETAYYDIQAYADEATRKNLTDFAAAVAKEAERVRAGLVLLAGEIQARSELRNLLPPPVHNIARDIAAGGRAAGADPDELDRQVNEVLLGQRLTVLDDLAERYRAGIGQQAALAVGGLEGVTTALNEANSTRCSSVILVRRRS